MAETSSRTCEVGRCTWPMSPPSRLACSAGSTAATVAALTTQQASALATRSIAALDTVQIAALATHVVAAFNGAFRLDQSAWGMTIRRREFAPPLKDVATLLMHDDGRLGFGDIDASIVQ